MNTGGPPRPFTRSLALALLALMLVVQTGPLCEAATAAAGPVPTALLAMGECHGVPPAPSTPKHPMVASCATGCFALPAAPSMARSFQAGEPVGVFIASVRRLAGLSGGPAPPPPRS